MYDETNGGDEGKGENLVKIEKIPVVNPGDNRGPIYQLTLPEEFQGKVCQMVVVSKHQGQGSGKHYHPGGDLSKNPEMFFVAYGKGKIRYGEVGEDGTVKHVTERAIEAGNLLKIFPGAGHTVEAETDLVLIELRRTFFDPENPDTVPFDF